MTSLFIPEGRSLTFLTALYPITLPLAPVSSITCRQSTDKVRLYDWGLETPQYGLGRAILEGTFRFCMKKLRALFGLNRRCGCGKRFRKLFFFVTSPSCSRILVFQSSTQGLSQHENMQLPTK